MHLIIVESPAKIKTISKYIKDNDKYKVLSSYGHIRDLPSKNGSVDVKNNFEPKYEVPSKSSKHITAICAAAKKAESIYLATDPDREGEAIAWHVIEVLKEKKSLKNNTKIHRISFNQITEKAVNEAISNPRDINLNLVDAQQARRILDYLFGFTLSPVLWRKLPGCKSAGRVQSVALRLICEKENEIKKFQSQEYWSINIDLESNNKKFAAKLSHINQEKLDKFAISNEKQAQEIKNQIEPLNFFIKEVIKKKQQRSPAPPFITSTLQQEAVKKLGFSTKKTMQIAQKLYEGVPINKEQTALITYMRTDSTQLSEDITKEIKQFIKNKIGKDYYTPQIRAYKNKVKNAQEAHEAIRPTNIKYTPEEIEQYLDKDFFKLYSLIWKRTVASQMPNAILNLVNIQIESDNGNYTLTSTGSTIHFDGFYKVYKEDSENEKETLLPELTKGDKTEIIEINPKQHFTEPPPRYTEATIVKKLEELGIGRPSTYSSIISVIQTRGYVSLEKKKFIPQQKGIITNIFLMEFFKKYIEYNFTANIEDELDKISNGKMNWQKFLQDFWNLFYEKTEEILSIPKKDVLSKIEETIKSDILNNEEKTCPNCNNGILSLKFGRFGAFIACSDYPECKFTQTLDNKKDNTEPVQNKEVILGQLDNLNIYLKQGPYGWYIQQDENDNKPKRMKLPSRYTPEGINLELAINLLSLPKELDKNTTLAMGKFGMYIKHKDQNIKIPNTIDPFKMKKIEIKNLIAKKKNQSSQKKKKS